MSGRTNKAEKRQQQHLSSDEDEEEFEANDGNIDTMMDEQERERFNQMSEKEREIEIYKRLEQREIQRTREQIKRKLELAAGKKKKKSGDEASGSKKKKRKISEGSDEMEEGEIGQKSTADGGVSDDDEDGVDGMTSDDEDEDGETGKKKTGTAAGEMKTEIDEEGEDAAANLSTAYHKPSEVANKQKQKRAMADLLNKRRDKKNAEERRKKEAQKAALDLDEIFGNNDNEDGKSLSSSSSSSSSRSSSPDLARSRTPSPVAVPIQKRDQLLKCQVIRRRLARIVHAPFFAKTVTGCFVRVQIGSNDGKPIYRIAQIVDVVETAKIYEVEPGTEVRTNKGFKLKICNNETQRVMRLEFLSNGELSETEFAYWLKRMQETDTPLPTVDFVERKHRELQDALNYKYTDAEISVMVKEKQRFKRNPTNFAFQKAELLKQKEDADQNGDSERARDLQAQINDLEEKAKKIENQRTKNLSAVTAINQRNRDHMKQIFLSTERMAANEHNKVKDDDPFTRKSARMKLVTGGHATTTSKSAEAMMAGGVQAADGTTTHSMTAIAAPGSLNPNKLAAANLGLGGNDLFSAHGIDINIDLNRVLPATTTSSFRAPPIGLYGSGNGIQQNRGGGPATTSASIPNKSAGSTRTLTLEEYKKKYSQRMAAASTAAAAAEPSA